MNKHNIILQAFNLHKVYADEAEQSIDVFKAINFTLHAKESVAIVGASGSGKSSLLHVLGGLDQPTQGYVEFLGTKWGGLDNTSSKKRNQYMGFIYQFHHLILELTALENTMLPLWIAQNKTHTTEQIKLASQLLDKLGLNHRLQHLPSQLSGGERQRVAIARALIHKPICILADEPTGNLDRQNATHVFNILKQCCVDDGASLVVVTHDSSIAQNCERVITLDK
jgi:lipoprotein-releasing system ATP-binding protein